MKKIIITALVLLFATTVWADEKTELQLRISNSKLILQNIEMQMRFLPQQYQEIQKALPELEAKLKAIEDKEKETKPKK
ncbi:MAG: hypothetical protein ABSG90_12735 [Dehalococcoidia bacterium]|jgi:peptidoglycan hydrolase CwlO-like protein